uniref:Uncharacterized protein n=1 Tax=Gopherus evgoodei TaxID=1825980 RepID=A0A8C4VGC3_9SAUR
MDHGARAWSSLALALCCSIGCDTQNVWQKNKDSQARSGFSMDSPMCLLCAALFKNSKKAFSVKDQNRDCFLGEEDLHNCRASLCSAVNSAVMNEAPDKLNGSDPEDVIRLLVLMLITMGDWLTDKVGELYREATIDQTKAISVTSSSRASLNIEQKTRMNEWNSSHLLISLVFTCAYF